MLGRLEDPFRDVLTTRSESEIPAPVRFDYRLIMAGLLAHQAMKFAATGETDNFITAAAMSLVFTRWTIQNASYAMQRYFDSAQHQTPGV